ncbi:hypothetical protein L596_024348 [Steinernema carpocapsae]|uniref:CD36 family protein n=1 Tax=Steinernema carpocapsae TaxID=34508 RepID=A0A4U5MGH0_STECR|nr:hypothetical protein L596_024348 [Steinernema carpocapsae]
MRLKCLQITALVIGAILIVLGIILLTVVPGIVEKEIKAINYLGTDGNGSLNIVTEKWRAPKYDMKMEIYVYNVKNFRDVTKREKPILEQLGPYTFTERQEKTMYKFNKNESRVFYKNTRWYYFSQELSCPTCFLNDTVVVPSIVYQNLVDFAMGGRMAKFAIETALRVFSEPAFVSVKVGELLYEGYEDPLLSKICNTARWICDKLNIPPRIGLFYGQNGTDDGTYEINTGRYDSPLIGNVYSWNNKTVLPDNIWWSREARKIEGLDGQLFPPSVQKGQLFHLFVGQIQRRISMEYKRESEFWGVPAYQFGVPESMNDPTLPANKGFNNPKSPRFFNDTTIQSKGALPAGLMDLSGSLPGNPRIYVGQPHFLHCPDVVRTAVEGIPVPNPTEDETLIDIEPHTGVVIHARRLSLLNLGVLNGGLSYSGNMSDTIIPLIWLRESISFDNDTRDELLNKVVFITRSSFVGGVALVTIGVLLYAAFITVAIVYRCQAGEAPDDEDQLIVEEEPSDVEGGSFAPI